MSYPKLMSHVPSGWSRDGWAWRLRALADVCEPLHPARAAELRAAAEVTDAANG